MCGMPTIQYLPGGANVPSWEDTLPPPGEYDWTCASFGPLESTPQTANQSVQPFLHRRKCLYFTMGAPSHKNCPFPWGDLDPLSNMIPWAHASPQPKQHLYWFSRFCKMIAECPYTLQWSAHFRSKLSHPMGASGPRCNTLFLGPTRVLNPNGISIASAVFAASLMWQTDRPRYSVRVGR